MKKNKKKYTLLIVALLLLLVTGCDNKSFDFSTVCIKCGDALIPLKLTELSRNIIGFVQVLVPVIIIVTGLIELVRAVIASEEKQMDEVKQKLIRKIIVGVMIFLVVAIVKFAFSLLGDSEVNNSLKCVSYFISTDSGYEVAACGERSTGTKLNETDYEDVGVDDGIIKVCNDFGTSGECGKASNCEWTYKDSGTGRCVAKNQDLECKDFTSETTCTSAVNLTCSWARDYNATNGGRCNNVDKTGTSSHNITSTSTSTSTPTSTSTSSSTNLINCTCDVVVDQQSVGWNKNGVARTVNSGKRTCNGRTKTEVSLGSNGKTIEQDYVCVK